MPQPVSAMTTSTESLFAETLTWMRPSSGVFWTALSRMLTKTRWSRCASPMTSVGVHSVRWSRTDCRSRAGLSCHPQMIPAALPRSFMTLCSCFDRSLGRHDWLALIDVVHNRQVQERSKTRLASSSNCGVCSPTPRGSEDSNNHMKSRRTLHPPTHEGSGYRWPNALT